MSDYLTSDGDCRSCGMLIPQCNECSNKIRDFDNQYVFVGNPPDNRKDQKQYVGCNKCNTTSQFYNMMNKQCKPCSDVMPGCQTCDMKG